MLKWRIAGACSPFVYLCLRVIFYNFFSTVRGLRGRQVIVCCSTNEPAVEPRPGPRVPHVGRLAGAFVVAARCHPIYIFFFFLFFLLFFCLKLAEHSVSDGWRGRFLRTRVCGSGPRLGSALHCTMMLFFFLFFSFLCASISLCCHPAPPLTRSPRQQGVC